MNPGEYNITVRKGGTFSLSIGAEDDLGAINFTSTYNKAELKVWPAWMKEKGISGSPLLEMTTENVQIVLGTDSVLLQMDKDTTGALDFVEGIYELKLSNDLTQPEIVDPLLEGKFFVKGLG